MTERQTEDEPFDWPPEVLEEVAKRERVGEVPMEEEVYLDPLMQAVEELTSQEVYARQTDTAATPGACKCVKVPAGDGYLEKVFCHRPGFLGTLKQDQNTEFCPEEQRTYMEDGFATRIQIMRLGARVCKPQVSGFPIGERWLAFWQCMGKAMTDKAKELKAGGSTHVPPIPPARKRWPVPAATTAPTPEPEEEG